MLFYTLRTLALCLALWDAGCNIARYILCTIFSAYSKYHTKLNGTEPVPVKRYYKREARDCVEERTSRGNYSLSPSLSLSIYIYIHTYLYVCLYLY